MPYNQTGLTFHGDDMTSSTRWANVKTLYFFLFHIMIIQTTMKRIQAGATEPSMTAS